MSPSGENILVTGAVGQIGSELTLELRSRFGNERVIAMGRKTQPSPELRDSGPFVFGDVTDLAGYKALVEKHDIGTVYHLAAILSGTGEKNPQLCYNVNLTGLFNVLEVARETGQKLFCPSSIAVWGPDTPKVAPQETPLHPTTMYGVTKVAGEVLCDYYFVKYGVDVRGIRYPGLISWKTPPGGGTTDFAVAIYYDAVQHGRYECFVKPETRLPMMYMPDAIKGTLDLMDAPLDKLKRHADYNHGAMSFTAADLAEAIRKHYPDFEVTYEPDFRQAIADSWPDDVDDTAAREDWGWSPAFDLEAMTNDMLENLKIKFSEEES